MLPWLLCLVLQTAVIALWVKCGCWSFDEIANGLAERLDEDTHTLLSLFMWDPPGGWPLY